MSDHAQVPYRTATTLVTLLTLLLLGHVVVDSVACGSDWLEVKLLQPAMGEEIADEAWGANAARQQLIGMVQFALFLPTAIIFLMWIYRANVNARALGARDMKFRPGWSVGWFFVPILSLYKPFYAVQEIWKASIPGSQAWQSRRAGGVVGAWWAFWILTFAASRIAATLSSQAEQINEFLVASWATLAADSVAIPAALLALLVVRGIHGLQERRADAAAGHLPEFASHDDEHQPLRQTG